MNPSILSIYYCTHYSHHKLFGMSNLVMNVPLSSIREPIHSTNNQVNLLSLPLTLSVKYNQYAHATTSKPTTSQSASWRKLDWFELSAYELVTSVDGWATSGWLIDSAFSTASDTRFSLVSTFKISGWAGSSSGNLTRANFDHCDASLTNCSNASTVRAPFSYPYTHRVNALAGSGVCCEYSASSASLSDGRMYLIVG